jgi:phage shock protein A
MAQSLGQALWYKLRFWNKKAAEQMTDAEAEGEITIDDAKAEVIEFQNKVRDLIAADMGTKRELDTAKTEFSNLDSTARKIKAKLDATDPNDEKYTTYQKDLQQTATFAVSAKKKVDSLELTSSDTQKNIEILEGKVDEYQTMISDSENKFTQLKARNMSTKISQQIADAASGLASGKSAIGKLKDFEKAVQANEDKYAATEEINAKSVHGTAAKLIEEYGVGDKDAVVSDYINSLSTTTK